MEYTSEAAPELTLSYIKLLIESCQMKVICGCDSGIMREHSVCKDKNIRLMAWDSNLHSSLRIDSNVMPIFFASKCVS